MNIENEYELEITEKVLTPNIKILVIPCPEIEVFKHDGWEIGDRVNVRIIYEKKPQLKVNDIFKEDK